MQDITAYQNEINALTAANEQSEADIEQLSQEAGPAYEALGRKVYELIGLLPADLREQLTVEVAQVDDFASKIVACKQDIERRGERIDQLEELIKAERERVERERKVEQAAQAEQDQSQAGRASESEVSTDKAPRKCPVCGEAIYAHYRFCPGCAGKVEELFPPEQPAVPPVAHKECPKCHKQWDDEMNFCADCGVPLVVVRG